MAYDLFWSERAIDDLAGIFEYLRSNWTDREVDKFKETLSSRLETLQQFPALFPTSEAKEMLRRSVISRQTSIFYSVNEADKAITIVRLFDNRMDPGKLED